MSQLVLQLDNEFMHNYKVAFKFGEGEKPIMGKVLRSLMELEVVRMARNPVKGIKEFVESKPKFAKSEVVSTIEVNNLLLNALYRALKGSVSWKELTKANYAEVQTVVAHTRRTYNQRSQAKLLVYGTTYAILCI